MIHSMLDIYTASKLQGLACCERRQDFVAPDVVQSRNKGLRVRRAVDQPPVLQDHAAVERHGDQLPEGRSRAEDAEVSKAPCPALYHHVQHIQRWRVRMLLVSDSAASMAGCMGLFMAEA
jgi:hypothetical protein